MEDHEQPARAPDEQQPLIAEPVPAGKPALRELEKLGFALFAFIFASSAAMWSNEHVLRNAFPYPFALAWCQFLTLFLFTRLAYCVQGDNLFPSMAKVKRHQMLIMTRAVPMSVAFGAAVVFSYHAYRASSTVFMQLCNCLSLVGFYMAGILLGMETGSTPGVLAIVLIFGGAALNASSGGQLTALGVYSEVLAAFAELFRCALATVLLAPRGYNIDILTLLHIATPTTLFLLTLYMLQYYDTGMGLSFVDAWPDLLKSSALTLAAICSGTSVLKYGGMVTFCAAVVLKDVVAFVPSGNVLYQNPVQLVALVLVTLGTVFWTATRMYSSETIWGALSKPKGEEEKARV